MKKRNSCLVTFFIIYALIALLTVLSTKIILALSSFLGLFTLKTFTIILFLLFLPLSIWLLWKIYEMLYYHGQKFKAMKARIQAYINNCNELNQHIENLKHTHLGLNQLDYGQSYYYDTSRHNYRRPELRNQQYAPNIYNCSRSVCDNARRQPFKYICKYFNLPATEETLSNVEAVLNNFEAAEQGKFLLQREKTNILTSIQSDIPLLIRSFSKQKLEQELGFDAIDFNTSYFPRYIFQYISPGGNASMRCDIILDIPNLNRFIEYLSQIIKFRKSAAGQRALMTSRLRQYILQRDGYTCKRCSASLQSEPNLLLEIDHIIPISKGGLTTEDNLQTLCWRCNRSKGAKL